MNRSSRSGWNTHGSYSSRGGYNSYMEQNPGFGGGYGSGGSGGRLYGGQGHGFGDDGYGYNDGMGVNAFQEEQNMLRNKLAMANNLLQQQTQLLEEVGMQVTGGMGRGRGLMGDGPAGFMGSGFSAKRPGSEGYGFSFDPKRQRMEMSFGLRGGRGRGRDAAARSRTQIRREARVKTVQKRKDKADRKSGDGPKEPYDPTKNSVSYCHVCHFDYINLKKWKEHTELETHKLRMSELENKEGDETSAEELELLEKIKHQTDLRENQSWVYCETCDKDTVSSLIKHKGSPQHEYKLARCRKGCKWCEVKTFKNFTELLEHRATEQHIKERIKRTGKRDMTIPEEVLEYELDELPEFHSGRQIGSEYIVAVTGYLCKLCQKYYPNLKSARQDHCNSHDHYAAYKKAKSQSLSDNVRNLAMKARFCFKDGEENRYMTGREYEEYQLKVNEIDFDKLEEEVNEEKRLEEEERQRQEEEDEKLRVELEAAKKLMASNGMESDLIVKDEPTEEDMEAQDEEEIPKSN